MKFNIRKVFIVIAAIVLVALVIVGMFSYIWQKDKKHKTYYKVDKVNIKIIHSKNDYNGNGVDDYTDILLGARRDAENKPKYKSAYYTGGYPPEDEGVCTDVIWRAFKNAGYNLKAMVDHDIKKHKTVYPDIKGKPDSNIDFRRVPNLKVYFQRNAESCTTNPYSIDQWQLGDIVIFGKNYSHIGIISDKRDKKGEPYLIYNAGQQKREEDGFIRWYKLKGISAHYRFNRTPKYSIHFK